MPISESGVPAMPHEVSPLITVSPQSDGSVIGPLGDPWAAITILAQTLNEMQEQQDMTQQRLTYLERQVDRRQFAASWHPRTDYGPTTKLVFMAIKGFFLLLVGFVLVGLVGMSLHADLQWLKWFMENWLQPLGVLTFCAIVGAIVMASLK
jgi:uncharacterized integral membrane protein